MMPPFLWGPHSAAEVGKLHAAPLQLPAFAFQCPETSLAHSDTRCTPVMAMTRPIDTKPERPRRHEERVMPRAARMTHMWQGCRAATNRSSGSRAGAPPSRSVFGRAAGRPVGLD